MCQVVCGGKRWHLHGVTATEFSTMKGGEVGSNGGDWAYIDDGENIRKVPLTELELYNGQKVINPLRVRQ